ncbi:MAG: Hpt domain-containing protein, partial [Limisphaerales bacterium]
MAEESPDLNPELLKDFYAECDEHLNVVRQSVVVLERGDLDDSARPVIEKLFRSFHSLKGIIGMVGIRSAEELAHRTEDYLRELSAGRVELTPEGLDLLANSAQMIEHTVAAFRDKEPLPSLDELLGRWTALISSQKESGNDKTTKIANSDEALQKKIDEAVSKGFPVWKCTFQPTPSLNDRGVNVNEIRERLNRLGEIIHAAPRIGAGAIAFEFYVAVREKPQNLAEWEDSGATLEELKEAAPVAMRAHAVSSAAPASLFVAPSQVVRVELSRLDDLMRVAGELVIQKARLEEQINRLSTLNGIDTRGLQEVNLGFGRQFRDLRETVMRLRMVPVGEVFDRL